MEGAPPRLSRIDLAPGDHAYGPIGGTEAARAAVAAHYNRLYRRAPASTYDAANVSIASGGRLVLSRIFAALGPGADRLPDAGLHRVRRHVRLPPAPDHAGARADARSRRLHPDARSARAGDRSSTSCGRSSSAIRAIPTGRVIRGDALRECVAIARRTGCLLILDEFYSHFIYERRRTPGAGPVSAAASSRTSTRTS